MFIFSVLDAFIIIGNEERPTNNVIFYHIYDLIPIETKVTFKLKFLSAFEAPFVPVQSELASCNSCKHPLHLFFILCWAFRYIVEKSARHNREIKELREHQGNGLCLKGKNQSGKNEGIRLMLETIRKISRKMFALVSSINRFPNVLKKFARKQNILIMKLLAFIFHDGNRAHFAQTGESLLNSLIL